MKFTSNYFNLSDFGKFSFILSNMILITSWGLLEINSGLYRFSIEYQNKSKKEYEEFLASVFSFPVISVTIVFFLSTVFINNFFSLNPFEIFSIFLGSLSFSYKLLIYAVYNSHFDNKLFFISIISFLSTLFFPTFFFFFINPSVDFFLSGYVLANLILSFIYIPLIFRKKALLISKDKIFQVIKFSLPMLISTASYPSLLFIFNFFLLMFNSEIEVGYLRILLIFLNFGILIDTFLRWTINGKLIKLWELQKNVKILSFQFRNSFFLIFLILFFFNFIILTMKGVIIYIFSSNQYLFLSNLVVFVVIFLNLRIITSLIALPLIIFKKTHFLFFIGSVEVVLGSIFILISVYFLGLFGGLIALICIQFIKIIYFLSFDEFTSNKLNLFKISISFILVLLFFIIIQELVNFISFYIFISFMSFLIIFISVFIYKNKLILINAFKLILY